MPADPPVCPIGSLPHNLGVVAGLYSALAAVLAGVAFTALIFLIAARLDRKNEFNATALSPSGPSRQSNKLTASLVSAYRMLVSAFMAGMLSALGFATIAGDAVLGGVAVTGQVVLESGFALAAAIFVYAIILALDAAEALSEPQIRTQLAVSSFVRSVFVVLVAPSFIVLMVVGLRGYLDLRYGVNSSGGVLAVLGYISIALQVVLSWIFYPIYIKRAHKFAATPDQLLSSTMVLSWILLVQAFACAVGFALINSSAAAAPCPTLHPIVPALALGVTSISLVLLTIHATYHRVVVQPNPGQIPSI